MMMIMMILLPFVCFLPKCNMQWVTEIPKCHSERTSNVNTTYKRARSVLLSNVVE